MPADVDTAHLSDSLYTLPRGLPYTKFQTSPPRMSGLVATFSVRNTGKRAGADIAQLYLVSQAGKARRRLVGFQRVELAPSELKAVELTIDPRLLADWIDGGWRMPAGRYHFALGESADRIGSAVAIDLPERHWR